MVKFTTQVQPPNRGEPAGTGQREPRSGWAVRRVAGPRRGNGGFCRCCCDDLEPAAMSGKLDDDDRRYLRMAVELSRSYRDDPRRWPFGAVLVGQGKILGRGFNQVWSCGTPAPMRRSWHCARPGVRWAGMCSRTVCCIAAVSRARCAWSPATGHPSPGSCSRRRAATSRNTTSRTLPSTASSGFRRGAGRCEKTPTGKNSGKTPLKLYKTGLSGTDVPGTTAPSFEGAAGG